MRDVAALTGDPAGPAQVPPTGAAVYIHLDRDVLDPTALPVVAVPTPDGVTVPVLARALSALRERHDVVGVGITGYVPDVDHDQGADGPRPDRTADVTTGRRGSGGPEPGRPCQVRGRVERRACTSMPMTAAFSTAPATMLAGNSHQ